MKAKFTETDFKELIRLNENQIEMSLKSIYISKHLIKLANKELKKMEDAKQTIQKGTEERVQDNQ